jgi:hypothetical protein
MRKSGQLLEENASECAQWLRREAGSAELQVDHAGTLINAINVKVAAGVNNIGSERLVELTITQTPTLTLVPRSFASLLRAREFAASRGQLQCLSKGSGSDLYGHALTGRRRNGLPSFTQAFDVKPNRLSHLIGTLLGRGTGSDNTREVGTVG